MDNEILFEKFKIISCIKKNDFSAIYLADHIFLGKKIFLKTLNTDLLPDSNVLLRFKREAKILAQLDHPHIIKVFDFGAWKNFFYISFEYFESRNLRYFIKQGSLNETQKETVTRQLCEALSYAHERNIIHRDLKPENILIDERFQVKIADFGLAILKGDSAITEASSVVGTPAYMSPEQISGKKLTAQSDLFSLGIIIYELFSGKNIFLGADAGQTLNNILNLKSENVDLQLQPLPQHLRNLLSGMLQKDPARRFASANEALEFLPGAKSRVIPVQLRHKLKISVVVALSLLAFLALFFYPRKVAHNDMPALAPDTVSSQEAVQLEKQDTALAPVQKMRPKPERAVKEKSKALNLSEASKKEASYGKLWVECLPWANLTIDTVRKETTPLSGPLKLSAGEHQLSLAHPAYPTYRTRVFINSGRTTVVKINLDTLMGYLQCNIIPWGNVYLDDKYLGQSPFRKPLMAQPGPYKLRVENKGFVSYEKDIILKRKDTLQVQINFYESNLQEDDKGKN